MRTKTKSTPNRASRVLALALAFILCLTTVFLSTAAAFAAPEITPLGQMSVIGAEDPEKERSTVTIYGFIDPETPLPATVQFSFVSSFTLESLHELDDKSGDRGKQLEYTATETSEISTTYTLTLETNHSFFAGFAIGEPIFDRESQMGGSAPLASLMIMPPNDLSLLIVGFVAPSKDFVGAGTDVILLDEDDTGAEIYGMVFENVKKGEMKNVVVAFASREKRDAALEEASAEASAAAEAARQQTLLYKLTRPLALITMGAIVILAIAVFAMWRLTRKPKDPDDESDDKKRLDTSDDDEDEDWFSGGSN